MSLDGQTDATMDVLVDGEIMDEHLNTWVIYMLHNNTPFISGKYKSVAESTTPITENLSLTPSKSANHNRVSTAAEENFLHNCFHFWENKA